MASLSQDSDAIFRFRLRLLVDKAMQSHYLAVMATVTEESTLTDRYQTTVPEVVRKALKLGKRDKIRYSVSSSGSVILSRVGSDSEDPVVVQFLTFLENDLTANPQKIAALSPELASRARELTRTVEIDLDAPLDDEE